ncbi:hypothetical protein N7519_011383 [Penicillium mononematosum]|uniref:uncharacterized protein n=1 Tax=Penicillium mononematosum TaxID=268346 RepID=UPI002546C5F8|nr:uncharacterized protein N7519_011383 [Penicillium mononematosum]KAJ6180922.1 hypothetical protein N7519_011383 [Penicillium mononematosum]
MLPDLTGRPGLTGLNRLPVGSSTGIGISFNTHLVIIQWLTGHNISGASARLTLWIIFPEPYLWTPRSGCHSHRHDHQDSQSAVASKR